ncbi:MAG TPA: 2-hydroxyacyl-CoA dehydratase family protein [Sedimentisphaerales bacterium]|nr:2-hydroxyacyl-CoA dehydratase family protein [Sedimentisphaerales bacterium]
MKTIIYTCPYVPAEWIAAHGLHAGRVLLDGVDPGFSAARAEGVCPYVRSFIGEVINNRGADGAVVTTVCDQMRRAFDIIVRNCDLPAFLMNVPSTWQTLAAQKLYVDELKRLGGFLIGLGGKAPSKDTLAETMLAYDDARTSIRSAREHLSAKQFAEAIAAGGSLKGEAFGDGSSDSGHPQAALEAATLRVPLAIVGGPLMKPDFDLLDMIEQLGGRVVLDATETGERGMCPKFDRRRLREDPLLELADAYFAGIPDASRRPNSELYRWLKRELAGRAVRGIIFRRYVWCDLWHAELGRLKEWCNLPVLDIDSAGDNETDRPRISNRIRAFMEMLQ